MTCAPLYLLKEGWDLGGRFGTSPSSPRATGRSSG